MREDSDTRASAKAETDRRAVPTAQRPGRSRAVSPAAPGHVTSRRVKVAGCRGGSWELDIPRPKGRGLRSHTRSMHVR